MINKHSIQNHLCGRREVYRVPKVTITELFIMSTELQSPQFTIRTGEKMAGRCRGALR